MKKKVFCTFLALLMAVSMAGCAMTDALPLQAVPVQAAAAASKTAASASSSTTAASASSAAASAADPEASVTIVTRQMPVYLLEKENKDSIELSFVNGQNDIPYIEIGEAAKTLKKIASCSGDNKLDYSLSDSKGTIALTRENGSRVEFDFNEGNITYYNFDSFFASTYAETAMDIVENAGFDEDGKPAYFSREGVYSFERKGYPIEIDLKKHDIPVYYKDGKGYVPLQTLSDLFVSQYSECLLYNGQAVFDVPNSLGDMEDLYYSAPTGKRSSTLAQFSFNELQLALDVFYGLKNEHNIKSFEEFFSVTGIDKDLLSEDTASEGEALSKLCTGYFGDGHSGFIASSFYAGKDAVTVKREDISSSLVGIIKASEEYGSAREDAFPDGVPGYQEIGDTAYVTFDEFKTPGKDTDYYKTAPTADAEDTIGIIMYANSQIRRKGSPIKNVVIDLSNNGGGELDAAVYVIGWFLGSCTLNLQDTVSDAESSTQYVIDVNGDRKFDDKDSVSAKNLYCLTSPFSFSCGNLVPATFKRSGKVTLIGKNSGGGACVVMPMSTADGNLLQISGNRKISTNVNGSLYSVDGGAEVDFTITKLKDFYDREALTKYIDGLY